MSILLRVLGVGYLVICVASLAWAQITLDGFALAAEPEWFAVLAVGLLQAVAISAALFGLARLVDNRRSA